ncbi:HNH endonuclease family protein, partial [Streptosporangium sp. NPDC001682]
LVGQVLEIGRNSAAVAATLNEFLNESEGWLNRIALTVVKGKNENYAFTIFESLNTTGEPLTAFETFKPRVVSAEGLGAYRESESRKYINDITDYLSKFAVGTQLQNATRDLLISFALAETGEKLPKRLADQRVYLKDQYERHAQDSIKRLKFVKHLRDTSDFIQHVWEPEQGGTPNFRRLPTGATTDTMQLCIAFLRKFNHSIVIGPLVRFYSKSLNSPSSLQPEAIQDLESAIQAITAFSVFWRASRRTTGNIDQEYRKIMTGVESTHIGPLARTLRKGISGSREPGIDLAGLRQELVYRLAHAKNVQIANRQQWVDTSSLLPTYKINQALTRFLLLSAYHDTVEDKEQPGLINVGKEQSSPSLTFWGWRDEIHLSVEHVVPQDQNASWGEYLGNDKEVIHRIGNLVLLPQAANSSASNRGWSEKRVLYAALGARSKEDASKIFTEASKEGIEFSENTGNLVELSKYMPHLAALGEKNDKWDKDFIQTRSQRLLELAWMRLRPWLGPEDFPPV